jgi:hypothetical protein
MSDQIVINVVTDPPTNITISDAGENVYLNPLTLNQGIINHSVTHQSGGSDVLFHNLLGGLSGGSSGAYFHLSSAQYQNLTTGSVIRPSDTGAFYPASNPSGFITGVDLSSYATISFTTGISGSLQSQITTINNTTGIFITESETGQFYAASNPSGFITGVDLSAYVTGAVVRPSETGVFITQSQTGQFYPASNPSGFITGVNLSSYATTTYVTGVSGALQSQVTTLNSQTGSYVTGSVVRPSETGALTSVFYPRVGNPSQFITNASLIGYATTSYVTGASGFLQTQITTLNSQTGSYVTGSVIRPSDTGAFYPRSNPSGFITGVDLSFSGNYYTKSESESRYVNTTGTETILGDKTFHDRVYINNLYVTGLETIVNTTNTNVASNYIMLNLTGGAVDGGLFFVTGSGLTGINDSGAILGFDHSDKFKFGIGTRASDLSVLDTIASVEEMTGISGSLQTQISTLNSATGNYALKAETGVFITQSQTGQFYPNSNPSGYLSLHSHGNITSSGTIGTISGLVVTTTTNGALTTSSRSGIDSRSSFPNSDVTAATASSIANTLVRRDTNGDVSFDNINIEGAVNTDNYIFTRQIQDYIGDDLVIYNNTTVLTPATAYNNNTTTITFPARNGTVILSDEVSATSSPDKIVRRNSNGFIEGSSIILNDAGYIEFPVMFTEQIGDENVTTTTNTIITAQRAGDITINISLPSSSGVLALTTDINATAVGLGSVDNTSDVDKPVSTAMQSALDAKADLIDPVRTTLTGNGSTSVYAISGASGLVNPSALIVAIDGVLQEPSVDYTVATGTVTFTSPLPSGSKAVIVSPTNTLQVSNMIPADGSVTSAKIVGGVNLSDATMLGTTTLQSVAYSTTQNATDHINTLGLISEPLFQKSFIHARDYIYNVSNQTNNRYGWTWRAVYTANLTPNANFTKGTRGEILSAGQSYNFTNTSTTGDFISDMTWVAIFRPIGTSPSFSIMRQRSYNAFYTATNGGTIVVQYYPPSGGRALASKIVPTTDYVCIAWSGNDQLTRAGIWHNNTWTSGSHTEGSVTNNGGSENFSIGAGQGGAGNGLEFVAFASYAGLLTEQELGILARRFYETHL